jgi:uncharacterized protein YraI
MQRSTLTLLVASLILTAYLPAQSPGYRVTGVAADDVLNLRSGPAQDNDIVGKLAPTASGIVIISDTVLNGNDDWVKIRFQGIEGWTRPKYLQPLEARISTTPTPMAESTGGVPNRIAAEKRRVHQPVSDIEKRKALMQFRSMGAGYLSSPDKCIVAANLIRDGVISPSDQPQSKGPQFKGPKVWEIVLIEYDTDGLASSRQPNDWPAVNDMVEAVMEQDFDDKPEFLRRFFIKAVNRKVGGGRGRSDSRESRLRLAERALDLGADVPGGVVRGLAEAYNNLNQYFGYNCLSLETFSTEERSTVSRVIAKIKSSGGGGLDSFQQGLDLAREESKLVPLIAASVLTAITGAVVTGAPKVVEKGKKLSKKEGADSRRKEAAPLMPGHINAQGVMVTARSIQLILRKSLWTE